jgi:hypothetical protein
MDGHWQRFSLYRSQSDRWSMFSPGLFRGYQEFPLVTGGVILSQLAVSVYCRAVLFKKNVFGPDALW